MRPARWHPARLDRRPLISLPLLLPTASPSLNRLPRAMRPALAPGAAGSPAPDQPAAPALASQPKPEPPGQGDAPGGWHPARLDRRPLISLPLLLSTASPSLNRLPRAMRPAHWHPARLDRRPLISLPLLLPTASPSRNRLPRAMRPAHWHPARLDRPPLISLPLLLPTASPSLNRLPRAMRRRAGTRRGWIADP